MYGVTLLQERETILGLAGSAAIAAGVVTVNSAKIAKVGSGHVAEGIRGSALLQYAPVVTSPYAADIGDASPDAQASPGGSSWREWSSLATRQLADMQSRRSLDGIQEENETQAEHGSAQQAKSTTMAGTQLGSVERPNTGAAGSLRDLRPASWTAGNLSALSPRLHRSSMELQRLSQASGASCDGNKLDSERPQSQTADAGEQGSRRIVGVRTDRSSLDRSENLRDREPSFGDWHFQRTPGK